MDDVTALANKLNDARQLDAFAGALRRAIGTLEKEGRDRALIWSLLQEAADLYAAGVKPIKLMPEILLATSEEGVPHKTIAAALAAATGRGGANPVANLSDALVDARKERQEIASR